MKCKHCGWDKLVCGSCYSADSMSEWISTKNMHPPDSNDVLVIDNRERMAVSCYFTLDDGKTYHWEIRDDQKGLGEVTFWMPLPNPPDEK